MKKLPELTHDLIAELEANYPLRSPSLTDSDREVWFKAGQRDVVELLAARLKAGTKRSRIGVPFGADSDNTENDDV